ncbi:MAG: 2-oxo acid dehydrogenase subunit E2 [Dehalococcoidia bacterium]|nr:2-oxo acid dehydrogenase subunit E2 [Dehalococcoidia bacterium]
MPDFKLPSLGEDIQEADVLKLLVSEGDTVTVDQPLMEIETEKATLDVPAEAAGTISKIHVAEGDTITVGQLIITIESGDSAAQQAPSAEPAEQAAAPAPAEPTPAPTEEPKPAEQPEAETQPSSEPEPEVEAPPETPSSAPAQPAQAPSAPAPQPAARPAAEQTAATAAPGDQPAFASPSVRKFAREVGVDIDTVQGSGPGGRISEDDVKLASRNRPAPAAAAPAASAEAPAAPMAGALGTLAAEFRELPDFSQWGPVSREKLSRLRRTVARNMSQSWTEIPHVHLQHHADITAMEDLRQQFKERAREAGGNLTISVMMLKVVASALRAHPKVNSSYDVAAQELILKDYVHIGVAVDTDRGLVVPKIEDVDEKNIIELSIELNEIAERARTNSLTVEEMRGSTFTVTNLGSLGTGYFGPIINWPEVAVLGLGRAQRQAVWNAEKNAFEPRLIMPMSLGHDHRVIDGADGARFMTWIVEAIKNPMLMALEG